MTASSARGSSFETSCTRTQTLQPNGRARDRSGFLPVNISSGVFGAVFFVGVRFRNQTAYSAASPQNDSGSPLDISMARIWPPIVPLSRSAAPFIDGVSCAVRTRFVPFDRRCCSKTSPRYSFPRSSLHGLLRALQRQPRHIGLRVEVGRDMLPRRARTRVDVLLWHRLVLHLRADAGHTLDDWRRQVNIEANGCTGSHQRLYGAVRDVPQALVRLLAGQRSPRNMRRATCNSRLGPPSDEGVDTVTFGRADDALSGRRLAG